MKPVLSRGAPYGTRKWLGVGTFPGVGEVMSTRKESQPKELPSIKDLRGGEGPADEVLMPGSSSTAVVPIDEGLRRTRQGLYRSSADLRQVCELNGINEEQFSWKPELLTTLEIFMTSPVDLEVLRSFPSLRSLKVMKQPDVEAISGLEEAPYLEELWVMECNLVDISGLQNTNLRKLILSCNKIPTIGDNLSHLSRLQTLWLNDNQLTSLAGLEALPHLQELWACRNRIHTIGTSLAKNSSLKELNLADNQIGGFKEILALCSLRSLESLTLNDPHFGANPVCQLCNYQTLVIFHLTQLTKLDMRLVNDKSKHMAQSIFLKKRMYYNMRVRTLKRNAGNLVELAEAFLRSKTSFLLESSKAVVKQLKDCEYEMEELFDNQQRSSAVFIGKAAASAASGENSPASCDFAQAVRRLEERRRVLSKIEGIIENRLTTMEMSLDSTREAVHHVVGRMIESIMLEFNTGGNIRFEEGSPKEPWYGNFRQFVVTSFNAKDFECYGVSRLDVNRITRIHNRLTRQRFDARVKAMMRALASERPPKDRSGTKPTRSATAVEYLFLRIQEPYIDNVEDCITQVAEEGFRSDNAYSPAIRLSTALWDADCDRLRKHCRDLRNNGIKDLLDASLVGQVLVVKIYRGRCRDMEVTEEEYRQTYSSGANISPALFPGCQSVSMKITDRPGALRQWYILDPNLAVPEFIV